MLLPDFSYAWVQASYVFWDQNIAFGACLFISHHKHQAAMYFLINGTLQTPFVQPCFAQNMLNVFFLLDNVDTYEVRFQLWFGKVLPT